jgi:hypothetical protein
MIVEGVFEKHKDNVIVTELPIGMPGRSPAQYKSWLEKSISGSFADTKGKNIQPIATKYDDLCTNTDVKFILYDVKNPSIESLRLRKTFVINMVYLDYKDRPVKYTDIQHYIKEWYKQRIPYYYKRKDVMISELKKNINHCKNKIKLIESYLLGLDKGEIAGKSLVIIKRKKENIYKQLDNLSIPHYIYDNAKLSNIDQDDIIKHKNKIKVLSQQLHSLENTSPQQMYKQDLLDFLQEYKKRYNLSNKNTNNYQDLVKVTNNQPIIIKKIQQQPKDKIILKNKNIVPSKIRKPIPNGIIPTIKNTNKK